MKDIPGFEGKYKATRTGKIYSVRLKRTLRGYLHKGKAKYYWRVELGKGVKLYVHCLVCLAWHGPAPFERAQVRHLDGDTFHNKPDNLAWGSQADNERDKKCRKRQSLSKR